MNRISTGANSFALRLFALIVVPLLGLSILALQRIEREGQEAEAARVLVDEARLEQAVSAVVVPAQLEQIALEGLASVDELRVPRELVVALAGVDFAIYTENADALDIAVEQLASQHGDIELPDGSSLASELASFQASLDEQRRLSDNFTAKQSDIRSVFGELAELLDETVEVAGLTPTNRDVDPGERKLAAVTLLMRTAGDRGRSLLNGLLGTSTDSSNASVTAAAQVELAADQLRLLLADPDEVARHDELMSQLGPLPGSVGDPRGTTIGEYFDADYIQESAGAVLNQLEYLELLQGYSAVINNEVVTDLEARADDAEQASNRTRVLVLTTIALSLVLVLVIAWATLRPLQRLTRRAELIGGGDFDAEPLAIAGPSDVRTLITTVNAMAETLAGVDCEIERLAKGDFDNDNEIQLPGAIGESIDRSFSRLESMMSRLHASEMLASAIVAKAADAIWTIDDDGRILSANDTSAVLLGISSEHQIGRRLSDHLRRFDGETTLMNTAGSNAHVVVSNSVIEGDESNVTAVMAHDVSERREFQERLAHQARHDALTGLPNRVAVLDALDKADPDAPIAVLFADLDGFKSVNDMQGHLVGDHVLTDVGNRLRRHVRRQDVVGRIGGDEFVMVMNKVESDDDVLEFAHRLVAELEQPYAYEGSTFTLSASVGVATFPAGLGEERLTPLDAIRRADGAVYAAKARGRGHVEVYDFDLEQRLTRDAEIEHSLRSAIRDHELELHLQPVLDLGTGTFASAEALVRWNRPGLGLVPPGEFIPIAEKSALIEDIGRWVLQEACRVLTEWRLDDPTTTARIAVNIAGSHLLDGDLLADVDATLALTGADPSMLELELTESQLMEDYGRANEILAELRRRGVTIAIDDFGTGYSSMAYLRELPIDTLKIDQSFIAPIVDESSDTTVIDALVTVGQALGLSIVAEGIETGQQLRHLTALGCDRAQGFLMARPMPIDDATPVIGQEYGASLTPN
ncbi:MAG: EAL domain-containing protein [Ilumatobacter sp.]